MRAARGGTASLVPNTDFRAKERLLEVHQFRNNPNLKQHGLYTRLISWSNRVCETAIDEYSVE